MEKRLVRRKKMKRELWSIIKELFIYIVILLFLFFFLKNHNKIVIKKLLPIQERKLK
jgi:hypothetical protein